MIDRKCRDTFKAIQIETYHGCNLNCKTCPNSVIKKNGELMEWNVFKKIIADLKKANYGGRISPYLMNEPTLDKRLKDFIIYIKKEMKRNLIVIGSNGVAVDFSYFEDLFRAGLDQVIIACYDKKIFDKFRYYEDGATLRLIKWFERDTERAMCNRAGNVEVGPQVVVNLPCPKGLRQTCVNYKGDLIFCCSDYHYIVNAGNVMDNDLMDLFNSSLFKHYRYHLSNGDRQNLGTCSKCNFLRRYDK